MDGHDMDGQRYIRTGERSHIAPARMRVPTRRCHRTNPAPPQRSNPPTRLHTLGHKSTLIPTRGVFYFLSSNQTIKGDGKDCCIVQLPRCYMIRFCASDGPKCIQKKKPWQPVHDRHYSISTYPGYIVPVLYTVLSGSRYST